MAEVVARLLPLVPRVSGARELRSDLNGRAAPCRSNPAVEVLSRLLDGVNAADIGALAAVVWLVVRLERFRSENNTAHDGIVASVDRLEQDVTKSIDGLKLDLTRHMDGVGHDPCPVKQDAQELLTGDVACMRALLQGRRRRD